MRTSTAGARPAVGRGAGKSLRSRTVSVERARAIRLSAALVTSGQAAPTDVPLHELDEVRLTTRPRQIAQVCPLRVQAIMVDVTIRPERPYDYDAIRAVNDAAFGQAAEGELVDALRQTVAFIPELSLVAQHGETRIGHILFTKITVVEERAVHSALALAPMAVTPSWQRRRVGSALVDRGLQDARLLSHSIVIVLGHPGYYARFGFRPAGPLGIRSPFDAPDEAFLALELQPGALQGVQGKLSTHRSS